MLSYEFYYNDGGHGGPYTKVGLHEAIEAAANLIRGRKATESIEIRERSENKTVARLTRGMVNAHDQAVAVADHDLFRDAKECR